MRYIFLTGLLTLVYVALIFLAVQVFAFTAPLTVAAATVAAVLLFNPTRRRLQRALNRRYHHRPELHRTVVLERLGPGGYRGRGAEGASGSAGRT